MISKQKEIFNELADEKLDKITELDKKVNRDDLIYEYKGNTADVNFDQFDNALDLIHKIKNGRITITNAKNDQKDFKSSLGKIKKGNKKSRDQKNVIYNVDMLYKARKEAIKFFDGYSSMISEAKLKATKGTRLTILTSKRLFQRLPIALAQVKPGNNSETLLNEIRKIVYSLYQSKKSLKKYITT